jgi:hypothetical protein
MWRKAELEQILANKKIDETIVREYISIHPFLKHYSIQLSRKPPLGAVLDNSSISLSWA